MVRIAQIELFDFKNIGYGKVAFPKSQKGAAGCVGADIVGIYGQNGSGKTSVVEALRFIKAYICEDAFDSATVLDFFHPGKREFSIKILFLIEVDAIIAEAWYELTLAHRGELIWASREKLSIKEDASSVGKKASRRVLFDFSQASPEAAPLLLPKGDWSHLLNADEQLKMATHVAFGIQQKEHVSPLFGGSSLKCFISLMSCNFDLYRLEEPPSKISVNEEVLSRQSKSFRSALDRTLRSLVSVTLELSAYFEYKVKIFTTLVNAGCSLNILSMDIPDDRYFNKRNHLSVNLFEPVSLSEDDLAHLASAIKRISNLLGALVPGLSIKTVEVGQRLLDDGNTIVKQVEFLSCRDGVEIPLRCESEGVRKLITLSLALMEVHSYRDAFIAIDELDSGVFEYLLGELLSVIESFGKGQLLFTAHNLRVLELLPTSDILLTTADPQNRFVRFKGSRPTNNLRDQYLRSVSLGDDSSKLYMPTDKFSIDDALCLDGGE